MSDPDPYDEYRAESDRAQRAARDVIPQLKSAREALYLIGHLETHFGLTMVGWDREYLEENTYGRKLTNEEWDRIRLSKPWREAWWVDDYSNPTEHADAFVKDYGWPDPNQED